MEKGRRTAAVLAAAVAVSSLTACTPDPDPAPDITLPTATVPSYPEPTETVPSYPEPTETVPPPPEPTETLPSETPTFVPSSDEDCPDDRPVRLPVATDVAKEVPYLDKVALCTDTSGTSTAIVNKSEAVWTVDAPFGTVQVVPDSIRSQSFSEMMAAHSPPVLPPSSTAYVAASAENVTWTLSPDLSAGWVIHEVAADRIRAASEAAFLALVDTHGRHPARRAVAACTVAGVQAWEQTRNEPASPVQAVASGLGLGASGALCHSEWQQWRLAASQADPPPPLSLVVDDINRLNWVSTRLTTLDRLGKVVTYVR